MNQNSPYFQEMNNRELFFTEKVKNMVYNAKYTILSLFQGYDQKKIIQPHEEVFILGKKFISDHQNIQLINQQIYELFQNTIWITYRSGFPQLPNELVGSYISDTGWGCMVRVGQMIFAQIIKKHRGCADKSQINKILTLFNDVDKKQPFSIQNIARQARIQYGIKPGDWYNPSQISFILSQLHESSLAEQTKLRFKVFNSGNLFFDLIAQKMIGRSPKCKCQTKPNDYLCPVCNKCLFSIGLIILTKIGLYSPEEKYLKILQKIMQIPNFQGLIGGKPQKALYIVGKHNRNYIYLDPHYVHGVESITVDNGSYFCGSFRSCRSTSIDSSIGLSFYLKGIQELNEFYLRMKKLKDQNNEDFFIFLADETSEHAQFLDSNLNNQFNSENFEIL